VCGKRSDNDTNDTNLSPHVAVASIMKFVEIILRTI